MVRKHTFLLRQPFSRLQSKYISILYPNLVLGPALARSIPDDNQAGRLVKVLFIRGNLSDHQVYQDSDEPNGRHSFKGHVPHQQRKDRGCELLHKGSEEKCLRIPGLRLFRLSDLIETHKDSLYGKPSDGSSGRHYSRKNPYNQKRLKQTDFRLLMAVIRRP